MRSMKFPLGLDRVVNRVAVGIRSRVPERLRTISIPEVDRERVVSTAKDVGYTVVGAAVLTFQRAQVARRDLASWATRRAPAASRAIARANVVADHVIARVAKTVRREPPQN